MEEEKKDSHFIRTTADGIKKTSGSVWLRSVGFIMAGLGLVAGLAWNDAIQTLFKIVFPSEQNSLAAKFIYAIVVTVVIVIVGSKVAREEKGQ